MQKNMQKGILMVLTTLIFAVILSGTGFAADGDAIYVATNGSDDNDGYTWNTAKLSIKNATGTVNENGTIHIANGLYTGDDNRGIDISKSLTIAGQSKTGTIIDADNDYYIFYIDSDCIVTFSNLTMRDGDADYGGAIYNDGNLTVVDCTFTNNYADSDGGAIYNEGTMTIADSTFTGNEAYDCCGGGAIYNDDELTVTGCTFTGNEATDSDGGAIYNDDELTITDCTFTGNEADYGGAIYGCCGQITVKNCTFTNNYADTDGGAIYYDSEDGPMTITGSTFTGNEAEDGGAIYNEDGTMTITGSTFTSNEALDCCGGGAIYNYDELTVTGCTFIGNIATDSDGGAIYNEDELTITDCTFKNNSADCDGGAIYNCCGTVTITGCTFTGNTADEDGGAIYNDNELTITECTFTNNYADDDGGAIYNDYDLTVNFCRIVGNTAYEDGDAIYNAEESYANAEYNWWGSNDPDFDSLISGDVDYTPWLYMTITADPTTINNGETSLITVSFNNYSSDGTTYTSFNPAEGHIPDGTPVTFNTDLGSIGCKTIQKQTSGGVATATLTADETAGTAHVNAVTDAQTVNVDVIINPKSGLYLTVTPNKTNPVAGDTVVYTLKVGNEGPDTAKDVVMTYVVPEGLEFGGATVDVGEWEYDPATRTITWTIGEVPVGDPYMWLSLSIAQVGQYLIDPILSTSTYDPTLDSDTQSLTVNAAAQTNPNENTNGNTHVNAASRTIGMQETGLPINYLILAVLMVLGGLLVPKRK